MQSRIEGPPGTTAVKKRFKRPRGGGASPKDASCMQSVGTEFLTESLNAAWLDPVALISSILDRSAEVIGAS